MVGLSQFGHRAVISDKECAACLTVAVVAVVVNDIVFVDALVVVPKYGWNVDAIAARHAIFAVGARDGGIVHHHVGGVMEKLQFLVGERLER